MVNNWDVDEVVELGNGECGDDWSGVGIVVMDLECVVRIWG